MYYLAIDIGASSGRHILGRIINGKLNLEEIHRFQNEMTARNGQLCWDIETLFSEIITGLAKCKSLGKIPQSVGIDTWGVDFVLIKDGKPLGNAVAYRDKRTIGMDKVLDKFISEQELYSKMGIQKQPFNTVYQLLALKQQNPTLLDNADGFLLMPEFFSYLLSGIRKHEYTITTTTGMVNTNSKNWDFDLIKQMELPLNIFGEIATPGTKLGKLLPEIQARVGFDCDVIYPCTHDTASAVVSAPIDENSIYLSSGTWSLIGTELATPICTDNSRKANLTNEGGFKYRYRYLKNIMGLWIIQSIKKELDNKYSYEDLCNMAKENSDFPSRIDVNEHRFLAPSNMIDTIKAACANSGQKAPQTIGELVFCVYQSLADSYAQAVQDLETLTGKSFNKICIIGGGSQNTYLNELTAKVCRKTVTAGPVEGTAIGNILVQMLAAKQLSCINEARQIVMQSFDIKTYTRRSFT